jgi:aspartate/methionine/tyrosine aminotransferase
LSLRERIAHYYQQQHQLDIELSRIQITTGSSAAFQLAFLACFDSGDTMAIALPCYPSYRNILSALGLNIQYIETTAASGFQPTADDIKRAYTKNPFQGLLVASPSNPVGSIISAVDMAEINAFCQQNHIQVISDEIYHRLSYQDDCETAISSNPNAMVINSFSKYYSMTGWRVGWMINPQHQCRQIEKLAQNFFICPPTVSQYTAQVAMDCDDELSLHFQTYAENRQLLLAALSHWQLEAIAPDGAFYLWIDVSSIGMSSSELCQKILSEAGVAMTSGIDFDPLNGERYLRISYARDTEQIKLGIARLNAWFAGEKVSF